MQSSTDIIITEGVSLEIAQEVMEDPQPFLDLLLYWLSRVPEPDALDGAA